MTIYNIEENELDNLFKNNKNIKEFQNIISDFLKNKKVYNTSKNTLRQHKINLILAMNENDIFIIVILWILIVLIICLYLTYYNKL